MILAFDACCLEGKHSGIAKSLVYLLQAVGRIRPDIELHGIHRQALECDIPESWHMHQLPADVAEETWRTKDLPAFLARLNPDVMHYHDNGKILCRPGNFRVTMTLQDVLPLQIPRYFGRNPLRKLPYWRRTARDLRMADCVMTCSDFSRRAIQRHFPFMATPVVVPYGPTLPQVEKRTNTGEPYLLYVGGYDPRKGIEQVLRVQASLWQSGTLRIPLVIAGKRNYYSDALATMVAGGISRGELRETGYLSDVELAGLVQNALCLVYPSRWEGFGLPPLEAMASGCPVITTRRTSLGEVCGDAAVYFDWRSDAALADAIVRMAGDPALRSDYIHRGIGNAVRFSWDAIARSFIQNLFPGLKDASVWNNSEANR